MNKKAIIYYSTAALVNLLFVLALVFLLSWPISAEIPIAISLYIQLLAGSKYIFVNVIEKRGITINKIRETFTSGVQSKTSL